MLKKYMTLNELADWAAYELYEVTEGSNSVQLDSSAAKRTVIYGFNVSKNKEKQELLKKIINNPDADWKKSGIDEKIIEQIRVAKQDHSDSAKEFIGAINAFVADRGVELFKYVYEHIKEIKNRLVRTDWIQFLLYASWHTGALKDEDEAELTNELLYAYPYTDRSLIGGYAGDINLYYISHNYDMGQVYDTFYQFIWNRILAEASKAKPNNAKIENLCNVAIVKLIGINNSRSEMERDKFISEYELRKVFNAENVSSFIKEHIFEIKQYQDLFNRIRTNEAQALLYKQATDKRHLEDIYYISTRQVNQGKNLK